MTERISYRIKEAAEATGLSVDVIRTALHSTNYDAKPPHHPLRARRLNDKANAPYLILADDLRDWIERFPEAS